MGLYMAWCWPGMGCPGHLFVWAWAWTGLSFLLPEAGLSWAWAWAGVTLGMDWHCSENGLAWP
jgi:hypothetical protein